MAPNLPSILPLYTQTGHDSLHYILGAVEGNGNEFIVRGIGGRLPGGTGKTIPAAWGVIEVR